MKIYNVCGTEGPFYVQGYPTGRTACTIETRRTDDRAEAEDWARRMNAGESPEEAQIAMYADD